MTARHKTARDAFAALKTNDPNNLLAFLKTQVLFPPDDTASTLGPADPTKQNFPSSACQGSIKLTVLFDDFADLE